MVKYSSENRTQKEFFYQIKNERVPAVFGRGTMLPIQKFYPVMLACLVMTLALVPASAQDPSWTFKYDAEDLPQTIIDEGGSGWQPRENETNGRPKYEKIRFLFEAQTGGLWQRLDDNSSDPNAPDAGSWARGYLFGTDKYDRWNGRMTLVLRIRDLGTDSQKSVLDIMNDEGNYWTLGHVAEDEDLGPAGWEFGQTEDGRNDNGLSDVRTGGHGEFVVIRIVVIDDVPGDNHSEIKAWQNGRLVYESERTDDISEGEFGEIAFRRTSGGGEQKMQIDWVRMHFGEAWAPGEGISTPAGMFDGKSNAVQFAVETPYVNGALSLDTLGVIRSVHDEGVDPDQFPIFSVDDNGIPTQFDMFYLGFDAMRDLESVGTSNDDITGVLALDKFGAVHPLTITGPGTPLTGPGSAPRIDYMSDVMEYNDENPDKAATLPYFPFDLSIPGAADGVARDIEVAVDWRSQTNAFQGFYIMDAFAGIHYVNNPEVMNLLVDDPQGPDKFFEIFGFRSHYRDDYAGKDEEGNPKTKAAPYFLFTGDQGFPIARDLEVMVRFEELTGPTIPDSKTRSQKAIEEGIDVDKLFQPIEIDENRADVSQPVYAPSAAITSGYAVLDGYGAVHTMLENADGEPIPAPWEDPETGSMEPSVNAPYFANPPHYARDIAVDIEIMPNGAGFCLLTRLGEVFVVNARDKTAEDSFVQPGLEKKFKNLGFDAARDLTLVSNDEGKIVGMYVVDLFGTIHRAGDVPRLPTNVLYFPTSGTARDMEISPLFRPVTQAQGVTVAD